MRLAIGYASFAICAACFYWDYKFGFEATKTYTAVAVGIYALLSALMTGWIYFVEDKKVYVGISPKGEKVEIATETKKPSPAYHLTITTYAPNSSVPSTIKISPSFTKWFDRAGHFVPLPFQKMLAGNVPAIGAADPTKAASGSGNVVQTTPSESAVKGASREATGSDVTGGSVATRKSTRNRKA